MFSPNNPYWNHYDWGMLAIMLVCSLLLIAWALYGAYMGIAPFWLTLPLCAGFLGWTWRPIVRWWRGG